MSDTYSIDTASRLIRDWIIAEAREAEFPDTERLDAAIRISLYRVQRREDTAHDEFLMGDLGRAYVRLADNYQKLEKNCPHLKKRGACFQQEVSLARTSLRFSPDHGLNVFRELGGQIPSRTFSLE